MSLSRHSKQCVLVCTLTTLSMHSKQYVLVLSPPCTLTSLSMPSKQPVGLLACILTPVSMHHKQYVSVCTLTPLSMYCKQTVLVCILIPLSTHSKHSSLHACTLLVYVCTCSYSHLFVHALQILIWEGQQGMYCVCKRLRTFFRGMRHLSIWQLISIVFSDVVHLSANSCCLLYTSPSPRDTI